MRYPLLATLFFAMIVLSSAVYADYEYYPEQGNNQKYSGKFQDAISTEYAVTQITDAAASITEPIVFDIDGDGVSEIFLAQSAGGIGAYNGKTGVLNSTIGGNLANQPVTCDIDGDGKLEYLAIVEDQGSYALISAKYNQGRFRVFSSLNVTPVRNTSNLVCGQLYKNNENSPDDTFYVMYLDAIKTLHRYAVSGNSFSGVVQNISDSVTKDAQYNNSNVYPFGSHKLLYSDTLDSGSAVLMFYAGNNAYAVFGGDNSIASINISPLAASGGLNRYYPSLGGEVTGYSDVDFAGGVMVFNFGNDDGTLTDGAKAYYATVKPSSNFFGVRTLTTSSFSLAPAGVTIFQPWNRNKALNSFGKKTTSSLNDDMFTLMFQKDIGGIANSEYNIVHSTLTGSIISQTLIDIGYTGTLDTLDSGGGVFLSDVDGDNMRDIVYIEAKNTYSTLSYITGSSNYTSIVPVANFSTSGDLLLTVPVSVDYNGDQSPDFIVSSYLSGETYFFTSSGETGSLNPSLAFTVNMTLSGDNTTTSIIQSSENLESYYYGVACSIEEKPLWSEQLTNGYNATTQNATIGMLNGSYLLDFDGLTYTVPSRIEGFYYEKLTSESFFDYATMYVNYQSTDDYLINIVVYGTTDFLSQWLQMNKTGNNLSFYKKNIGQDAEYIGSATLTNGEVGLQIGYTPVSDYALRTTYFNVTISVNNQSVLFTDTQGYPVSTIKNVLFTSQSTNATISLRSISMYKGNNIIVPMTLFNNGITQTVGGVPVSSGGDVRINSGYGYSIITNYNQYFYSICSYDRAGVVTQRHYLNRVNDFLDYQNFVDVRVNVLASPIGDVQNAENQDSLEAGIASLAESLGLKSVGGKMFFWVVLTMILVIGLFVVHWLLGLSSFVIMILLGAVLGFIPLWVILIFVILCAGIAAVGYRVMVSGQ